MHSQHWKRLSSTLLLDRHPWFRVFGDRVRLPSGNEIDGFLRIESRPYSVVFAVTDDMRVLLVEGYKYGPDRVIVQLPAGYLEDSEEPLAAAKRELREETGYDSDDWVSLGRFVVDGNYGVGTAHFLLARGAHKVAEPASGDLEEMEIVIVPRAEVSEYLRRGEVVQLASAAALALAESELRSRDSRAR